MVGRPEQGPTAGDELRLALAHGPVAFDFAMALIESMPVVPYIDAVDERTTLFIAPQVRDVLGIDAETYIAADVDPWFAQLHPDDREATIAELEQIIAAGGGKHEYRFVRPDTGETVWIEDRLTVIEVDGRRLSPGVLTDITRQKADADIIAAQVHTLERIDAVSQQFTDLVVHSGDVTAIVDLLAELVGGAVVLRGTTGEVLARVGSAPPPDVPPTLTQEVRLRGEGWGHVAVYLDRSAERADEIAVARATTNVALALLLEREANLITESARSALVNDVVMERITSGRELRRRARALGTDLGRTPLRVVVVEPVESETRRAKRRGRTRDRIREQIQNAFNALGCAALVASEGDRVVGIAAVPSELDRTDMDARLGHAATRVGVSELVDGDDLLRAYHHGVEAVEHAALRLAGSGAGAVVHFEDLGLSHLLSRLADGPELSRFVGNEIGVLLQHDQTHATQLVGTLVAFLAENGSKTATAQRLGVERRTVYYRLERIARLVGRDLADPEVRLRLDVALRGWEVLKGSVDPG
jgi:purine catabolism regulator